MASHKVLRLDQIGRTDGGLAEAEMALGQAAGFLGVIDEISLAIEVRRMADDLDGVFVGTHSAVGAHTPELSAGLTDGRGVDVAGHRQGGVSHIVYDAYGKSVLGDPCFQVFEHVNNLAGGGVFGTEAVAAAYDVHV